MKKLLLAAGLGLIAGLSSELLLEVIHNSSMIFSGAVSWYWLPLIGGALIAVVRRYFLGKNRSFGLDEIRDELETIEFEIMDLRDTVVKTILTYLTLVFGFSAGKFGPLIHMGGSLGSKLSYHMDFEEEDIRYFIASGVAAALAGFFTSPLFGIFFVYEILLRYRFDVRILYPIAAAFATLLPSRFVINHKFFEFSHGSVSLPMEELVLKLLVVGIVTGLVASLYQLLLKYSKGFLQKYERWYFPLAAGVLMAGIGWFVPMTFDIYYDLNQMVLNRELMLGAALMLLSVKFLTTGITFSLGGMGGGFAPAIVIGMLSGHIISFWLDLNNCGNIFGMVGMMAGYSNAPIATAILFTGVMGSWELFPPILVLAVISSSLNQVLVGRLSDDRPIRKEINQTMK